MGKHARLKEKQKWSNEKFHLENARKLLGIYFIDTEGNFTVQGEDWTKAKKSEAKSNPIVLILQERTEFCTLSQLYARIRSDEKIQKKALHLTFFEGESKPMLSRLVAQRNCETKIIQVNLKIQGVEEILKWELENKEVWTLNVVLISELRGIESYVWFRRLWRSVSQRRMPRETETHKQNIFHTKQCWSDAKATMEKEWKEVVKKAHKKRKVRKVHFVALMDTRHIQKYEYILENVRESNLKCGNPQAQIKKSCTRTSREDRWSRNEGRTF